MHWRIRRLAAAWLGGLMCSAALCGSAAAVDFVHDARPILAKHCLKCHGPDDARREAGLRLDGRENSTGKLESGRTAIVPGDAESSELIRRVLSTDEELVMPPPSAKNPLSDRDKQILREWIAAGAEYQPHWAFVAPRQVSPPNPKLAVWPRNPIDNFVLARLEAEGLQPAPPADRYTLARRVYLDLVGLPPTPEEADAFVYDSSPDAYERLVDRLLASPHYGERWARRWLDLARYADTNGYEKDRPRSIWPYRDWVIQAINDDMPFDQFTIEQLAGDMLPSATLGQRIATGFHRNTMRNEEGGIDPLEFRFYSMTDRVATTSTVWLGLTMGCAQCHTHKFDPITHREYYQFFGLMNNADEPEATMPRAELASRRAELEKQIAALEADLPNRFPADEEHWRQPDLKSAVAESGIALERQTDGSLLAKSDQGEHDAYVLVFDDASGGAIDRVRLEALADPALPNQGPGRSSGGNFVLSEISLTAAPLDAPERAEPVKLVAATADFSQNGFAVDKAIDGNLASGWAIAGSGKSHVNRTAVFQMERPVGWSQGTRWTVRLDQNHGSHHTLGKLRVSFAEAADQSTPVADRRQAHFDRKFAAWIAENAAKSVAWIPLQPSAAKSETPLLTILEDGSVLASGDQTKRDVYDITFNNSSEIDLTGITALRLEVLPDDRLPRRGPGRVDYEGPFGDFFLAELTLAADGQPVAISRATTSHANGGNVAANMIDGNPLTGWSIDGGQGRSHSAVFNLASPLGAAKSLSLTMVFEKYYAAGLGRFRLWGTHDARQATALTLPTTLEQSLAPLAQNGLAASATEAVREPLLKAFVRAAPELAAAREEIKRLRDQMPADPTTLVLQERPANNPRATFIHRRGEFLQPTERVEANTPSVLPPLPAGVAHDRLALARWLVSPENPLTGRVIINRQWAALFGQGIVKTVEDFGYQGEAPSHPELLDWLAVELIRRGWSLKAMHKLIVMSATYQQSSVVAPESAAHDPQNRLLARGPRFRVEAEMVRDLALKASGLLSEKIGGPSVYPPQPAGVSSEGAYGALTWNTSVGEDRYRRGLYTFSKRTAPFAAFTTFDAPTGEVCVARREVSNTALQALTLLNDAAFVEAAQTLGRQTAAEVQPLESRAARLFRRVLTRPPRGDELALVITFYQAQRDRLASGELDQRAISGLATGEALDAAAWTLVARSLLNLDETISKN
jgi:hypothetical protein